MTRFEQWLMAEIRKRFGEDGKVTVHQFISDQTHKVLIERPDDVLRFTYSDVEVVNAVDAYAFFRSKLDSLQEQLDAR